jgi:prepilin-type N-terminal cleavage/methylation domain-containing protein
MRSATYRTLARGFTLIEVLIVVVILGILAAIVVPQASNARSEARDATREQDMRAVEKALEMYANDNGDYPLAAAWRSDAPAYGGFGYTGPTGYIPDLAPEFMPMLPRDPNNSYPSGSSGYLYRSTGPNYKFLAYYTPENFSPNHPLFDPVRPNSAWQISTPDARNW